MEAIPIDPTNLDTKRIPINMCCLEEISGLLSRHSKTFNIRKTSKKMNEGKRTEGKEEGRKEGERKKDSGA